MTEYDADSLVERAKYVRAFQNERYKRKSGLHIYQDEVAVRRWLKKYPHERCIDFGCGNGLSSRLLLELGAKQVKLVDFVDARDEWVKGREDISFEEVSLWDLRVRQLGQHDFAVCTDVLEHIPENHVEQVLDNIKACLLPHGTAYFRIALWGSSTPEQHAKALEKYGGELHVTVKPSDWWLERLLKRFNNVEFNVWQSPSKPERSVLIAFCT